MIEDFRDWANDRVSWDYITQGSLIKCAAFSFMTVCYMLGVIVGWLLLFATAPVWIMPYIVRNSKRRE